MTHRRWLTRATATGVAMLTGLFAQTFASAAGLSYTQTPVTAVSTCSGKNAEVEQATDPVRGYVYEDWMAAGCQNIAFARSTDGGKSFSAPITVPGATGSTRNSWDPAVTVGSDGVVYAAFMVAKDSQWFPVVAASHDFGVSFGDPSFLTPPDPKNWGDRDFIAVDPSRPNIVYLTYDYGPNRTSVTFACAANGSCGFSTGDVNVVMQTSTDYGKTWGPMSHVSPGFPASGADSGPIFVEPGSGRIDVLLQDYPITNTTTYAMGPGVTEFTSSTDGGRTWSNPVKVGPDNGTMSVDEWWIDGALAVDSAGNLYASWDTQAGFPFGLNTADTGWLSFSTDHGATWSNPVQVTDNAPVPHIMEVTAGPRGSVYVSYLTQVPVPGSTSLGYAEFLRPYSIAQGWLTAPIQVSGSIYGDANTWPGDTTGLSTLASNQVVLSWGSGVLVNNQLKSEIFATAVTFNHS